MRRRVLIAGLAVVAVLAVACGWSVYQVYEGRAAEAYREQIVETGKRVAVDLTTIDHLHAESDVRRVLDSATGGFYSDFYGRSGSLIDVVKQTKSTSVGTVTGAGLESVDGDEGRVLVAMSVTTRNFGVAEQPPRYWRMRLTVTKVTDTATAKESVKVSKVEFVS